MNFHYLGTVNGLWTARYQSSKDNSLELTQVCEGLIGDLRATAGDKSKVSSLQRLRY